MRIATRLAGALAAIAACWLVGPTALAQGAHSNALTEARDLAADARLAAARGVPLVVLYSRDGCGWCEKLRREHLPLRDDIRLLGRLLGDTVREQEGAAFSSASRTHPPELAALPPRRRHCRAPRAGGHPLNSCRASGPSWWCAPSATSRTWPTSPRTSTTSAARAPT
jgi:hypothetical protein